MRTMKLFGCENRRCWYDRSQRGWVMQTVDENGNQVGECDYSFLGTSGDQKAYAATWLYGKPRKGFGKETPE